MKLLNSTAPDFLASLDALTHHAGALDDGVDATVAAILSDVRARGDAAVLDYTRKFDRLDVPNMAALELTKAEMKAAFDALTPELRDALTLARDRIEAYHRRQIAESWRYTEADGTQLGVQITPLDRVGLYVPGGKAAYPSSLLMNAVPAKVAGVREIIMVVPTPDGRLNPLVLAAAKLAGVDEIYRVGGAQAVAALAYGTETIRPVAKIVGPGNAFVAAAKRQVFGTVGIDMIAGPSEVLILADADNNPDWLAADLLAQAEHDAAAQSILITDAPELAEAVEAAVERQLATLSRGETAAASWRDYGAIILVDSLAEAVPLANRIAAEHLEIATGEPDALLPGITNAGAIFLGHHTPEAIGDYVGGSNHVLPTARSARFSSGLSVLDFVKRTSILRCDADALRVLGPAAIALARAEGLDAHGRSVSIRMNAGDNA